MHAPSIRTVAVAVGFLGVSMIVAGAAAAMSPSAPDEPVATAVRLDTEEAPTDVAPPAAPVEVVREPIHCTDTGGCDGEEEAAGGADDVADDDSSATVAATVTTDAPAECAWPAKPEPGDDERAWRDEMRTWAERWRAEAEECGWSGQEWAGTFDKEAWEEFKHERREHWDAFAQERKNELERLEGSWSDGDDAWKSFRDRWRDDTKSQQDHWRERTRELETEWKSMREAWGDHAWERSGDHD